MTKATAISPANVAFIKYWGKKDAKNNIPFNDSLSMNLSNCLTTTTVEFATKYQKDRIFIGTREVKDSKADRVIDIINIVRGQAGIESKVKVVSHNNFPSDAGIASSASAFSALALAASAAAGLKLSSKKLSMLARLGSGSACRSIPDGFAYWRAGTSHETSYASMLAPANHWDLVDIVAVVDHTAKKSSSTQGHSVALTSPHYKTRQAELKRRIRLIKKAILAKDFKTFGEVLEEEAVCLHVMAMTSRPPIFYWKQGTFQVIHKLMEWRNEGLLSYFTMDAGANVHVICRTKDASLIQRRLKKLSEVLTTIVNKPTAGTRLVSKHLF